MSAAVDTAVEAPEEPAPEKGNTQRAELLDRRSPISIMTKKPSLLSAVLGKKCPYCRKGQFYASHPYDLKRIGETLTACPECKRSYSVEYGFYMGAMYISYALSVFVGFSVFVACSVLFPGMSIAWRIATLSVATLVSAPVVYSYSKVLYGQIFLQYKGPSAPDYDPVRRKDEWR